MLVALLVLAAEGELDRASALTVIGSAIVISGFLPLLVTRGKHLACAVLLIVGGLALYAVMR